jgi:hypothetical protein
VAVDRWGSSSSAFSSVADRGVEAALGAQRVAERQIGRRVGRIGSIAAR